MQNIKCPSFGFQPIGGSFVNKIKKNLKSPLIGRFGAYFSTKLNKHPPLSAFGWFGVIFQQNLIKNLCFKSQRVVKRFNLLQMFWRILDKNLSHFANISSEEIDFEVWNCIKSSVIWRSRIVHLPDQKKLALKDWHTTVTWSVTIGAQFDIPSGRR